MEISKTIDGYKKDALKFLEDIISIKSYSKQEQKVAFRVASEMKKLGYDSVTIDKLGSVMGKIGFGKKKILYDAHTDTVGIADIRQWKTDPHKAVFKNGIVYGRGACDDKGCVASMVYAGGLVKKLGLTGDFTLYVSASVQEEIAEGYGIDYLLKHLKFTPDCVIIGEPSNLQIVRGHKGRVEVKITVKGKSCHASIPHEGDNAIYKALPLVKNIEGLNKKYREFPGLGKPVISVTQIETKNASINTVPDNCSFYIDRRTIVGETKKGITSEIKSACGKNIKIDYLKKFFNAWFLPPDHYLIKSAVEAYKKAYGKKADVILWPFCTNGSFTMGEKRMPTFGFGPGEPKYCHVANEQILFSDVMEAIKFYSIFPLTFIQKEIE